MSPQTETLLDQVEPEPVVCTAGSEEDPRGFRCGCPECTTLRTAMRSWSRA